MRKKKKRVSSDVVLVVVGIAAFISLQRCDDGCRYVYRTMHDCEVEWGYGHCTRQGWKYYSPEQSSCDSVGHGYSGGGYTGGGGGQDRKGERAIAVQRGGFGGSGRSGFGS